MQTKKVKQFIGLYILSFVTISVMIFPFYLLINVPPRSNIEILSPHLDIIALMVGIISFFMAIRMYKTVNYKWLGA